MTNGQGRVGSVAALRATALGFALATGYNSLIAIRERVPGEPLGVQVPISVGTGIVLGWGSAVAAPWPMPMAALLAATLCPRRLASRVAGSICAGLGVAGIVGVLIEPNTYKVRTWSPAVRRAVILHVATCAALATAGMSSRSRDSV
jgi:hypothetical protein